jgi:hypothetical protein
MAGPVAAADRETELIHPSADRRAAAALHAGASAGNLQADLLPSTVLSIIHD